MIVKASLFRQLETVKSCLDHSPKKSVSGHPLTVNMLKSLKLLQKEHESTFIIFFHHSKTTWFGKYLSQIYGKSYLCFVTHWLPMTGILFDIVRIYHLRLKCNHLKSEKSFVIVFLPFLESPWNFRHFDDEDYFIATLSPKLQTLKELFRPLSKKHRFRTPFDSEHVKSSQTLAKGAWEQFSHIFSSLWENMIWKISPSVIC